MAPIDGARGVNSPGWMNTQTPICFIIICDSGIPEYWGTTDESDSGLAVIIGEPLSEVYVNCLSSCSCDPELLERSV